MVYRGLRIAKAWAMLHEPEVVKHLDTESYMGLYRDAGYSEEETQRAGTAWANMRLDSGLGH